ncbi:uncharacterized protein LOC129580827 isoform X2 [Paramacrobiotus metropolitanus]|uniref:uncharacterized protein LOC129580827 isoform X2 n=1 Tax=Paramacrobiotus metropolitanus TaxID=2943436 RepID=UPI002445C8C8|nr:uncharacterized protein LOC129580827 isoform X2 [Paramacrobiotus metropolitanus]
MHCEFATHIGMMYGRCGTGTVLIDFHFNFQPSGSKSRRWDFSIASVEAVFASDAKEIMDTAHGGFDSSKGAARDEKRNQALIGEPFITGSNPASGQLFEGAPNPPPQEPGAHNSGEKPIALGGEYDRDFAKPSGELDFDAEHGHKTDIPWDSGQGSGFDKDWQYK